MAQRTKAAPVTWESDYAPTQLVPLGQLIPAPWNPRLIKDARFRQLCDSLQADPQFLWDRPILANASYIIHAGNMRWRAAEHLGWQAIPARITAVDDKQAKERALRDNNQFGEWEDQALAELLVGLQMDGSDLAALGFPDEELTRLLESVGALGDTLLTDAESQGAPIERASLADRFLVPPFSVLDARQGYWQARKRQWLALGIQSELGRGDNMLDGGHSDQSLNIDFYAQKRALETELGQSLTTDAARDILVERGTIRHITRAKANATPSGAPRPAARLGPDGHTVRGDGRGQPLAQSFATGVARGEGGMSDGMVRAANSRHAADQRSNINGAAPLPEWATETGTANMASGTSIFDPVLCELAYRWFCPPTGHVLDPFCGGSVRGIVAAKLGRQYTGLDLRPEQVQANTEQALAITPEALPRWLVGDSRDVATLAPGQYDLLFSCPPYADLERYSDDPRDLSTLDYPAFLAAYRAIIAASLGLLAVDRFACFVVGDVRDPRGYYRNFVADTVAAFQDAGARLYNEAILVTALGSLPIRVGKQFESGRKLGKTHQQVLCFVKGDARKATEACGPVETVDLAGLLGDDVEWAVEAEADG